MSNATKRYYLIPQSGKRRINWWLVALVVAVTWAIGLAGAVAQEDSRATFLRTLDKIGNTRYSTLIGRSQWAAKDNN